MADIVATHILKNLTSGRLAFLSESGQAQIVAPGTVLPVDLSLYEKSELMPRLVAGKQIETQKIKTDAELDGEAAKAAESGTSKADAKKGAADAGADAAK